MSTSSSSSLSSSLSSDGVPRVHPYNFDDHRNTGRILRELSESVLKTLTQLEPSVPVQDEQYKSLLHSRCMELKQYVSSHPIDEILFPYLSQTLPPSTGRINSGTSDMEGGVRVQTWVSNCSPSMGAGQSSSSNVGSAIHPLSSSVPSSSSALSSAARYKTEMCRSVSEGGGTCRYGDKCQYAHNKSELRPMPRHPRYKTQMCREYHLTSVCSYGVRCNFLHDEHKRVVPQQQSAMPLPADESSNDVFSQAGTWSGRTTPDLDGLLMMSQWTGSMEQIHRGAGSTGSTPSPTFDSTGTSPSPLFTPSFIPEQPARFSPYVTSNPLSIPSTVGTSTSAFPVSFDTIWGRNDAKNVFQFPSSYDLVQQRQPVGMADHFGSRF